jgi:hypothetical protein
MMKMMLGGFTEDCFADGLVQLNEMKIIDMAIKTSLCMLSLVFE